jgi:hypothetical protein
MWCVPKLTEEFRERMEDVLELYERPYDPAEPVVCLDEKPYQLLDEVRRPTSPRPGRIAKQDYEYRRCGTCCVFVAVEPKGRKRHLWVHQRRTKADFARCVKRLLARYPRAKRVHLVVDNLNTHKAESLIETFGKTAARKLLKHLVFHYTPKHASWLNMAEIEISVLAKQCLKRRMPLTEIVSRETTAWTRHRNRLGVGIRWTFNRRDAQRVFPELYRKKLAA